MNEIASYDKIIYHRRLLLVFSIPTHMTSSRIRIPLKLYTILYKYLCRLVLELVPEEISKILSKRLAIPVIGIGAGRFCDGQVQIVNDILGISVRKYKHVKKYENYREQTEDAFRQYAAEVKDSTYLDETHVNHLAEDVYNDLLKRIANK